MFYHEKMNSLKEVSYPFTDDSTMTATDGTVLPKDVFLDAIFHPVNLDGSLYIARIDTVNHKVYVADSTGIIAGAPYDQGQSYIDFYDDYSRKIGMMTVSTELYAMAVDLTFTTAATTLVSDCVFPQNTPGVHGFILEDGTVISGDVTFRGENGIVVTTDDSGEKSLLRFDVTGASSDTSDCVDLPDPVKCIQVVQHPESNLTITRTGTDIYIAHKSRLEDVCRDKNYLPDSDGNLPLDGGDPCDPPPAPPGPQPDPPLGPPDPCPEHPGFYTLSALGDLLQISMYSQPGGIVEDNNSYELDKVNTIVLSLRGGDGYE